MNCVSFSVYLTTFSLDFDHWVFEIARFLYHVYHTDSKILAETNRDRLFRFAGEAHAFEYGKALFHSISYILIVGAEMSKA